MPAAPRTQPVNHQPTLNRGTSEAPIWLVFGAVARALQHRRQKPTRASSRFGVLRHNEYHMTCLPCNNSQRSKRIAVQADSRLLVSASPLTLRSGAIYLPAKKIKAVSEKAKTGRRSPIGDDDRAAPEESRARSTSFDLVPVVATTACLGAGRNRN